MDKEVKECADKYLKAEEALYDAIRELPQFTEDCECEEPSRMFLIEEAGSGNLYIEIYCLECGGVVDDE